LSEKNSEPLILPHNTQQSMLSDRLLKILRCPKCHGELKYDAPREQLTCVKCRRTYEVKNGIPIMLENNEPARSR